MTASKVMDIISRLPGCAGQGAEAVSAYTQVKWKMLQNYWKVQNRNVQTFGFVYHDTNGLNHGPVWKTQSFLLSEIFTVILWQDCYGKANLRKLYLTYGWEKVSNWECLFVHREKGYSYLCMWMTSSWLERNRILIRCGNYLLNKEVDLGEPTSFLDHANLGCTQRQCEISKNIVDNTEPCLNPEFPQEQLKNYSARKICVSFVVLRHGGSCQEMCGTILWVGKQDDSATLQSIISMHWSPSFQRWKIEIRGRIVKSMLSNCSENACIWHELDDLLFYGQWINLHDRSQHGPKPVTNDYLVWSPTFIIHMNTNSSVMWKTLPNNADWDFFKTPILKEILKIQNLLQVEHCVFRKPYICSNQLDV